MMGGVLPHHSPQDAERDAERDAVTDTERERRLEVEGVEVDEESSTEISPDESASSEVDEGEEDHDVSSSARSTHNANPNPHDLPPSMLEALRNITVPHQAMSQRSAGLMPYRSPLPDRWTSPDPLCPFLDGEAKTI
uniref:Uncharacterized protein n=1 Tax=Haptolina brevifila TaxID=156173 RepID=A0A7S2NS25_9EUKA